MIPAPDFYARAPRMKSLAEWVEPERFVALPDDWRIFVADVEDSTRAIEQGRYKEVNALGAACIVAATNACQSDRIPFVFGGDGTIVAAPPASEAAVGSALMALRARALSTSGLRLRVGCISARDVRLHGAEVKMALRKMPAGFELALFAGGGLSLAEDLIKTFPDKYQVAPTLDPQASVDGLECRWNDVPSANGRIMTLLVKARDPGLAELRTLLASLEEMSPFINPVKTSNLPLTWPPAHLKTEINYKHSETLVRALKYAGIWLLTGLFSGIVRKQAHKPDSAAGKYIASLAENTDHMKLDDVFRAVIDVSDDQAMRIEAMLQSLHDAGHVDYGIHYSDHALMTCFVRSMQHHVHFVDGGNGGYAMAAQQLKRSLKRPDDVISPEAVLASH
ncbi:DUF3095 family protein [Lacisediminimonas profundi]|uniref:DUF3095 family protein n=1 Tax=Lacisediminimonas profundi TaxID=2603856 RepID=UPI00124AE751|nr:DUF3095 family protein [Lacisediminimonas profundi]